MLRVLCVFVAVTVTYGWKLPLGAQFVSRIKPTEQKTTWIPQQIYFPGPTSQRDPNKDLGVVHNPGTPLLPIPSIPKDPMKDLGAVHKPVTPACPVPTIQRDPIKDHEIMSLVRQPETSAQLIKIDDEEEDSCNLTFEPPEPDSQCCGVEATHNLLIVGGNVTQLEQYPWLVIIEYYNKTQNRYKRLCGGFLISGRYVISAGHCFVGEIEELGTPVNVILGDYDIANEGPDCAMSRSGAEACTEGATRVPIEKIIVHPKHYHDNYTNYNDIAIVKLSQTVSYSKYIRPICLPSKDISVSPTSNLRLYAAGWGAIHQELRFEYGKGSFYASIYDNIKRHVDLPFRQLETCKDIYGNFIGKGHLCAGGEKGKDSCKGDSGTPLMMETDGVFEAVGIVSAGPKKRPCGTKNIPAIYANVFNYLGWIKENIRANSS